MKLLNSRFKITSIIFLFFVSASSYGQAYDFTDVKLATARDNDARRDADGSPYITEDFSLVKISISDKKIFSARFNAHNGQMEVKLADETVILDNTKDIEVIFIKSNKLYKTFNYPIEDETKRGFLVVLTQTNNVTLLKKEYVSFSEKIPAKSSYSTATPATYKRENDSYFYLYNDKVNYLPTKKKDFLKLFPNYQEEIKNYMKENSLNPKNEDELITLINYIDGLVEKI